MRRLLPLAIVPLLLILPATAMAKPKVCRKATIRAALQAQNEDVSAGFGDIRCGDVTHDGHKDAVFTTLSGGTAGATHFGVLTGASATSGDSALVYYDSGYKLGIDRVNSRRFDVQQPFYKETDAN
ncbi:MAG: hypothetical protein QOI80_2957, partial [Solirubrobacteraceae bacterium]|nr:hypothetical protein [Solirubrobacteraceae bacterium]